MKMRNRHGGSSGSKAEVLLTPLIDCVFLLIVFFLVTSMLKRFERQIPINLAETSAAVAKTAHEEAYWVAIDVEGRLYQPGERDGNNLISFAPVADPTEFLKKIAREHGLESPVELIVERETPFQTVIKTIDQMELLGFRSVRTRIRDGKL